MKLHVASVFSFASVCTKAGKGPLHAYKKTNGEKTPPNKIPNATARNEGENCFQYLSLFFTGFLLDGLDGWMDS